MKVVLIIITTLILLPVIAFMSLIIFARTNPEKYMNFARNFFLKYRLKLKKSISDVETKIKKTTSEKAKQKLLTVKNELQKNLEEVEEEITTELGGFDDD